jgi:hypothetical protein
METFDPVQWYREECEKLGTKPTPEGEKKLRTETKELERWTKDPRGRVVILAYLGMVSAHKRILEHFLAKTRA